MYDIATIAMWVAIAGAIVSGAGVLWWALVGKKGEAEKGSKIGIIGAIVCVGALIGWGAATGLLPSGGPAGGGDEGGTVVTGTQTYSISSSWANSSLVAGSATARKYVWNGVEVNTTSGQITNATGSTNVTFTVDRTTDVDATTYLSVWVSSSVYESGDSVVHVMPSSQTYQVTYGQDGVGASSRKSEASPFQVKWVIDGSSETHTVSLNITLDDDFATEMANDYGTTAPDDVPYFTIHMVGGNTNIEVVVEVALAKVYA
jgi:hypothetical protein